MAQRWLILKASSIDLLRTRVLTLCHKANASTQASQQFGQALTLGQVLPSLIALPTSGHTSQTVSHPESPFSQDPRPTPCTVIITKACAGTSLPVTFHQGTISPGKSVKVRSVKDFYHH